MIPNPTKLIDILESNPDPKYNLSSKACAGILSRAERRGKKLPEILEIALRNQAKLLNEDLKDDSNKDFCEGVDLYNQSVTGEVSKTLNAVSSDADHIPCVIKNNVKCFGIGSYDSGGMKSSNPNSGIYEADTSRTLDLQGGNPACNQGGIAVVFTQNQREEVRDLNNIATSLSAESGMHQQNFVAVGVDVYNGDINGDVTCTVTATMGIPNTSGPKVITSQNTAYGFPLGFRAENTKCYEEVGTTLCNGTRPGFTTGVVCVKQDTAYGIDQQGGKGQASYTENVAPTLASDSHGTPHAVCYRGDAITNPINGSNPNLDDPCHTLTNDSRNYVVTNKSYGLDTYNQTMEEEIAQPIRSAEGGDCKPKVLISAFDGFNLTESENISPTLTCQRMDTKNIPSCLTKEQIPIQNTAGSLCASGYDKLGTQEAMNSMYVVQKESATYQDIAECLCERIAAGTSNEIANNDLLVANRYVVRRLTPLECERLQGFPDNWTNLGEWVDSNGKKHKDADSPRYKALGNSIALPFWKYLLDKISAKYDNQGTLGSLFSGIGGFDLCWEQTNGKGSCIWQSDIEKFPLAVCRRHFIDQK